MGRGTTTHKTTIEIEVEPYKRAKDALGTNGYKDTVNEALRRVERTERLQRGARAILDREDDLVTPDELEEIRRPRV